MGLNPGEGMDVCKYVVPSRHGDTQNSCRAASPLVRLVEEQERWVVPHYLQVVFPQNWGGGLSQIALSPIWCSKATPNSRRKCNPFAAMNSVGLDLMLLPTLLVWPK
ncbi:hypothetical protein TNCV_2333301 [Trichonephila clavipes]|nr:hypothetical protein TNCV_2333301 [Trichonephila clavipes]